DRRSRKATVDGRAPDDLQPAGWKLLQDPRLVPHGGATFAAKLGPVLRSKTGIADQQHNGGDYRYPRSYERSLRSHRHVAQDSLLTSPPPVASPASTPRREEAHIPSDSASGPGATLWRP